jgi:hypothetical protein
MSMNVLGCCKFIMSPGGFIGEPPDAVNVKEKREDYFEVIPVDFDGDVIEDVTGFVHPDVLKYMKNVGPTEEGDYFMHANAGINSGRMRYTLYDEWTDNTLSAKEIEEESL